MSTEVSAAPVDAVIVIGPLPPPVTGAAKNTAAIADRLAARAVVHRFNIASPHAPKSLRYHADRGWRVALAWPRVLWLLARFRCSLYLGISGGLGIAYDIAFLALARLLAAHTVIHHHNFTYVTARQRGMALALAVAGRGATHVFLCPQMRAGFQAQYGPIGDSLIVNNAAMTPPRAALPERPERPLTLGLLSNLCVEKGTLEFIAVFEAALAEQMDVTALMAGPIWDRPTRDAIDRALASHPHRFAWRGPVHGADKDRFFDDIDVFVFPTRYPNEAEPHVLYEAMAAGDFVIATQRGCIPAQLEQATGAVVQLDRSRLAQAIADCIEQPDLIADRQHRAWRFGELHRKSYKQNLRLDARIVEPPNRTPQRRKYQ